MPKRYACLYSIHSVVCGVIAGSCHILLHTIQDQMAYSVVDIGVINAKPGRMAPMHIVPVCGCIKYCWIWWRQYQIHSSNLRYQKIWSQYSLEIILMYHNLLTVLQYHSSPAQFTYCTFSCSEACLACSHLSLSTSVLPWDVVQQLHQ